jgi:hypothetical protein
VGEVAITNCVSSDTTWAVREIAATQRLNARAKSDRIYHLLISLRAGENPDAQTLRVIEERFCKELGYAEHQRVSVIHHDTDNMHIHVAINKIHPKTLTLHDPVRDYKKRSKLCGLLEHELGLAQDNHQRGQTRGNDVTPKSGQESFQLWLQRHAQGFIDATSWEEFHGIADAHDVRLDLREVVHILRVACRAAIPRRLLGVDSVGEFFLPKGNGWIGAGELMEAAIPLFTDADLLFIVAFFEDWVLLTKYGVRYPKGARSIAKIAWLWLPRITWRGRDAEDRLLRVILAIPLAAEPSLTAMVEATLAGSRQNRAGNTLLKLIFNHFACDSVVRDLPDLAFRVAEHLLGEQATKLQLFPRDQGRESVTRPADRR